MLNSDATTHFAQLMAFDTALFAFNSSETINIPVPSDDRFFTPNTSIPMPGSQKRSPNEIINTVSSFFDMGWLYGDTADLNAAVRERKPSSILTSSK